MGKPYEETRKYRAREVRRRLALSPCFSYAIGGGELTPAEAAHQYKLWVESWILPELDDLLPELRRDKQQREVRHAGS